MRPVLGRRFGSRKELREEAEMYPADRYWRIEMRDEDGYSMRQYVPKAYDEYFD